MRASCTVPHTLSTCHSLPADLWITHDWCFNVNEINIFAIPHLFSVPWLLLTSSGDTLKPFSSANTTNAFFSSTPKLSCKWEGRLPWKYLVFWRLFLLYSVHKTYSFTNSNLKTVSITFKHHLFPSHAKPFSWANFCCFDAISCSPLAVYQPTNTGKQARNNIFLRVCVPIAVKQNHLCVLIIIWKKASALFLYVWTLLPGWRKTELS